MPDTRLTLVSRPSHPPVNCPLTAASSVDASRTTPPPTMSASSRRRAAACAICTSRRRALPRNVRSLRRPFMPLTSAGGDCGIKLPGVRPSSLRPADPNTTAGPRPPPPRVLTSVTPDEDGAARVRRLALRQLRQGPHRARVPDRGAEDRQEGAQGVADEEAVGCTMALEFTVCCSAELVDNLIPLSLSQSDRTCHVVSCSAPPRLVSRFKSGESRHWSSTAETRRV
jgi:hypothetical protein